MASYRLPEAVDVSFRGQTVLHAHTGRGTRELVTINNLANKVN